ncbi:hypothetical protein FQZ97_998740 [compost metagenome]
MEEDEEAVRARHEKWKGTGLPIAQELMKMDFGPTFVTLDPDGHRLRVCLVDEWAKGFARIPPAWVAGYGEWC